MKEKVKVLELDKYEIGVLTNALICFRNKLIEEQRITDPVDELIIKVVETPEKKSPLVKVLKRDR